MKSMDEMYDRVREPRIGFTTTIAGNTDTAVLDGNLQQIKDFRV